MNNKYESLFPYKEIPAGANILIYGAGETGREYLKQIYISNYCNVVAIIDQSYEKYQSLRVPVYHWSKIPELDFDYVVIALKGGGAVDSVKNTLASLGVAKERVIFTGIYEDIPIIHKLVSENDCSSISNDLTASIAFSLYRCGKCLI